MRSRLRWRGTTSPCSTGFSSSWSALYSAPCGVARGFGKGGGFAVGLVLLPFVFYPILAFSDAQYQAPVAA